MQSYQVADQKIRRILKKNVCALKQEEHLFYLSIIVLSSLVNTELHEVVPFSGELAIAASLSKVVDLHHLQH